MENMFKDAEAFKQTLPDAWTKKSGYAFGQIKKEEERRKKLGFNEKNPWSIEKETKLKDELVDSILLVFTDTAARLNIELTNEHRIAIRSHKRSQSGFVEMKKTLGYIKEGFTKIEKKDFQKIFKEEGCTTM